MIWANALILGLGGLLLTVPVILHFIMQPKPKELPFPALRFVKQLQAKNRSSMRLRHWLLLLLRILMIALVALAMAGPSVASAEFGDWLTLGGIGFSGLIVGLMLAAALWAARSRNWLLIGILGAIFLGHLVYGGISTSGLLRPDGGSLIGDSQAPVAALVVIDTSPRMMYTFENQTRLDEAKKMAGWLIGQFPADSQVCVMPTAGDRAFFSVDVGAARKRAETLEIGFNSGTIPDALASGLRLLEKAAQERKEVYVISDMTTRSWNTETSDGIGLLMERNPGINIFVIDVGVEQPANFSLGTAGLSGTLLTPGSSLEINTTLSRLGGAGQRTVRLKIEQPDKTRPVIRDGRIVTPDKFWEQTQSIDVRENDSANVKFSFNEQLPVGYYHGTIAVDDKDALELDNIRNFTVHVTRPWKTLIVYGRNVDADSFVSLIAPGSSMFDCTIQSQRAMDGDLNSYRLVCLLNPRPISNATWVALEKYVASGGGLAIFAGNNAAAGANADSAFATDAATKVMGGALTSQWNRDIDNPFLFSPNSMAHDLFEPFREKATAIPWDANPVFKFWGFKLDERGNEFPTQVLMNYSNGQPALIERQIGYGRTIVMTTPLPETRRPSNGRKPWNDFFNPVRQDWWPVWLVVHQMARYLVNNNAETLNVQVGQPATLKNDHDEDPPRYNMFAPDTGEQPETVSATDKRIRYKFTNMPGQYRLKQGLHVRGFSVNLEPVDTQLDRIITEQLDQLLGADRYQVARDQDEIQRQQGTTRRGREFYPLLILMMVVILAVEFLMSNRFYQSA